MPAGSGTAGMSIVVFPALPGDPVFPSANACVAATKSVPSVGPNVDVGVMEFSVASS